MKNIIEFDKFLYDKKIVFTIKDYNINSYILWGEKTKIGNILNDTILFRKYINLMEFINGKYCKKDNIMKRIVEIE